MAEMTRPRASSKKKTRVHPEPAVRIATDVQSASSNEHVQERVDQVMDQPVTTIQLLPSASHPPPKTDDRVLFGCRQVAKGEFEIAIKAFNSVKPGSISSLFYCGCAHLEYGQITQAINDFTEALNLPGSRNYPIIYYKRAFACQSIGRYTDALLDYTVFIQDDEKNRHKGYLNRGLVHTELKQFKKALEDIQSANDELSPQVLIYYQYCLARAYHNCEEVENAQSIFNKILGIEIPLDATKEELFHQYFYRGVTRYELKQHSDAEDEFRQAKRYQSNKEEEADIEFYIALISHEKNDVKEAKNLFKKVIKLNPNHDRALFQLAMIYSEEENSPEKAIECFDRAHKEAPHKSDILYERAEVHYRMGHLEKCINDKRRAIMVDNLSNSEILKIEDYELILVRVSKIVDDRVKSTEDNLLLGWLNDKLCSLSRADNDMTRAKQYYFEAMAKYQDAAHLKKEQETEENLLCYALTFSLCNEQNHPIAAMVSMAQFEAGFQSKEAAHLREKFREIIKKIKIQKETGEKLSRETISEIITMMNKSGDAQKSSEGKMNPVFLLLLVDKLMALENFLNNQDKKAIHLKQLEDAGNENRQLFYRKLSTTLAHTFTAMAVTCGAGDDPIIKHDRTGTESAVGTAISTLGGIVGNLMPQWGGVVSFITSAIGTQLQEHEYQRFKKRMSYIADVGNILVLTDVANDIAFELSRRYQTQLRCLREEPEKVTPICCFCIPCSSCCKCCLPKEETKPRTQPRSTPDETKTRTFFNKKLTKLDHPVEQIVQFGVKFLQQAILEESDKEIQLTSDMKPSALVETLVEVICRANPDLKAKALRGLALDQNTSLNYDPHTFPSGKKDETWHLYDFYKKPVLRLIDDPENSSSLEPLSYMNSKLYGYRLGTREEYKRLFKYDSKKKGTKSCCCSCD